MQDIQTLSSAKLLRTLNPETPDGRAALAPLTEGQVEALRARHSLSKVHKAILTFLDKGGDFFLVIAIGFYSLWFSFGQARVVFEPLLKSEPGWMVKYGVAVLVLFSAVSALVFSVLLTLWLLNRFVRLPLALNKAFSPLASRPELCVDALGYVDRHETCKAYRDRVISNRPLVFQDYKALAALSHMAAVEYAEQKQKEEAAAQELACKRLHGVPVTEVQAA